jgi:acyl carrier protein
MKKTLKPPKEIISEVLQISIDQLDEKSCYGETPNWDSLSQGAIINALELNYKIQIPDADIENYSTLKAINELYKKLSS